MLINYRLAKRLNYTLSGGWFCEAPES